MPATPADAKGLLKTAIRLDDPVVFIEHKSIYLETGEVPEGEHLVPFGKADVKRRGSDVTVIAWSKMVGMALEAAEVLSERGVDVEVIDPRTLVPLDAEAMLESVGRTKRAVVVHEAHVRGGFGGEIAALLSETLFGHLLAPVRRVGALNVPLPMAPNLERFVLPSVEGIVAAVEETVGERAAGTPAGAS